MSTTGKGTRAGASPSPARSVVVTGAAHGIGFSIAALLSSLGWLVVGVDRDQNALEASLGQIGGCPVPGDVRRVEVLETARAAGERIGALSAWVNNAGIELLSPLHTMPVEVIDEVLEVDLRAVVLGTREALRSFLANGVAGSIVNISSIHARASFPSYCAYDTAKGGVEALGRYVCVEYGHLGIRCNSVAPGAVRTRITAPSVAGHEHGPETSASSAFDTQTFDPCALAPMRRQSEPEEIASVVAFLLDPASLAVNGHALAVDNGMSAWSYAFPPDATVGFQ
jgi:glucose 1-dehydrogenase